MITLAESKVLDNIKHGFTVKESAKLLSVSHETVKSHKASLMLKLDARNSAHLVYLAVTRGLISIIAMLMSVSAMGQANLTGPLQGDYVATSFLVDDALTTGETCLTICNDNFNPAIVLWGDSCISDDEWITDGWDGVIQDSTDFYTQSFLDLCETFSIYAYDDCALDTFGVTRVTIEPPGGIDRPSGVREFYIQFSALDATGKMTVETMLFRRTEEFYKCD